MTREQMAKLLPDGTADAVISALLDAMHAEITPYKDAAKQAADDLAAKVAELGEVSKKAATAGEKETAYNELLARYDRDVKAAQAKAEALEFDHLLDGALRGKGARNIKAARALMDTEALKASKDRQKDIDAAVAALMKAEDSAFLFEAQPTGEKRGVGAPTGGKLTPEAELTAKVRSAMGLNNTKKE